MENMLAWDKNDVRPVDPLEWFDALRVNVTKWFKDPATG